MLEHFVWQDFLEVLDAQRNLLAAEQQFTVAGLSAGMVAVVNKPTTNVGLDIVGVRVVGPNTLGITFANFTAGTLTPTAGEAYTVCGLVPADAANNSIVFQGAVVGNSLTQ